MARGPTPFLLLSLLAAPLRSVLQLRKLRHQLLDSALLTCPPRAASGLFAAEVAGGDDHFPLSARQRGVEAEVDEGDGAGPAAAQLRQHEALGKGVGRCHEARRGLRQRLADGIVVVALREHHNLAADDAAVLLGDVDVKADDSQTAWRRSELLERGDRDAVDPLRRLHVHWSHVDGASLPPTRHCHGSLVDVSAAPRQVHRARRCQHCGGHAHLDGSKPRRDILGDGRHSLGYEARDAGRRRAHGASDRIGER